MQSPTTNPLSIWIVLIATQIPTAKKSIEFQKFERKNPNSKCIWHGFVWFHSRIDSDKNNNNKWNNYSIYSIVPRVVPVIALLSMWVIDSSRHKYIKYRLRRRGNNCIETSFNVFVAPICCLCCTFGSSVCNRPWLLIDVNNWFYLDCRITSTVVKVKIGLKRSRIESIKRSRQIRSFAVIGVCSSKSRNNKEEKTPSWIIIIYQRKKTNLI